jgi:uncharacterized repeat protein (TIGR03803 family)
MTSWKHHAVRSLCVAALFGAAPAAAATFTSVYQFQGGNDGAYPYAGVVPANGQVYGVTFAGGTPAGCTIGCGTIFAINPASGAETIAYRFAGGSDGSFPLGTLIDIGGLLYGTTRAGGGSKHCKGGCGTVFSFDPSTGTETILHVFQDFADGAEPSSGLVQQGSLLYGTTFTGGGGKCTTRCGTVFSIDPATGAFTTVHGLSGGPKDGKLPAGPLTINGSDLYSTTIGGGTGGNVNCFHGCGTVYKIDPATGAEKIVYSFQSGSDGIYPEAGLTSAGGLLYGTAQSGANTKCFGGCGTLFSVDPKTGTQTVLHAFQNEADGSEPTAGVLVSGGKIYGVTALGGRYNGGVAFAVDIASNTLTPLHTFTGGSDGDQPQAALVDVGGVLFGTANYGGTGCDQDGCGTVFSITP